MSSNSMIAESALTLEDAKRRSFLKIGVSVSAAVGGGLLLGVNFPLAFAADASKIHRSIISDGTEVPPNGMFAPNAFVQIDDTGKVTLIMPKIEMGQGTFTSIPMLIAEELEVSLDSVHLAHALPNEKLFADTLLGIQLTGASTSIRYAWDPMRKAGATARVVLIAAAAQKWKVDPSSCHAEKGEVVHKPTGRRIGYGKLVALAATLPVPKEVKLKDPKDFKLIGTPAKRLDSPEKINGAAKFGLDVRLPGMAYAAIVNSPVFGGKPLSVDDSAAKKIPGVRKVIKIDNAVAVIADHTWAARSGALALKITWNEGQGANYSSETVVQDLKKAMTKKAAVARKDGDVAQGFRTAKTRVDAIYEQPFLSHAAMEPVNCTVSVRSDGCDIWVGTQVPTRAIDTAVAITGLPAEKIKLHGHLIGGSFGRRLEPDFIGQALKIGKQVASPVKVTWSREEDIQHDMYRPYYYDTISAGLDEHGKPIAWQHRVAGASILARYFPSWYKDGLDPDAVEGAQNIPYDVPNQLVDYVHQDPMEVPTTFWRGVGVTHSIFVVESFIDELAAKARIDPVAYRSSLLGKEPRAKNVLETAAKMANWDKPLPKGQGRGISVMHAFGSFLGMVVEVTIKPDGAVAVNRVVCAVDCGMVVNPDTIEAQIESGVIYGITSALYSEITIKKGRVEQTNFSDYRVLRMEETPKIEVHIVKSSEAPGGIGEPGTVALQPALANAIFAATGKRIRKLPIAEQLAKKA